MTQSTIPQPDPIRHLISAVNALGDALSDLHHEYSDPNTRLDALRQDCIEHADELKDLLQLLRKLLGE